MKKRVAILLAIIAVLAVALYFSLPGLLVGWARDKDRKSGRAH